jgi:SAM-dependent methyltransferase
MVPEVAASAAMPQGHELIRATCPLCGDSNGSAIAVHPNVVFVRCSACGLVYRRSHVSSTDATTSSAASEQSNHPRYSMRGRRRVQKARHQILDLLNHAGPGPLLDVGCSLGYTLQAARKLGLSAAGVDVRARAVDHCRSLGFRAEIGSLEALPFQDAEFQLVVMKHVLEHTPHPKDALREVRRVLRPGGGVFIAVPNGGYRKATRDPQHHKFFRSSARFGHYVYYQPSTLSNLLADTGFRTVRVHPHLIHRHDGHAVKVLQAVVAPCRMVGQRLLDRFQLRKEFWLCALRAD